MGEDSILAALDRVPSARQQADPRTGAGRLSRCSPTLPRRMLERPPGYFWLAIRHARTPLEVAARGVTAETRAAGATEDTVRLLIRGGSKLEPQRAAPFPGGPRRHCAVRRLLAADCAAAANGKVVLPRRRARSPTSRYSSHGGDEAGQQRRRGAAAIALGKGGALGPAFAVGDVVVEGLKAKPKYGCKVASSAAASTRAGASRSPST